MTARQSAKFINDTPADGCLSRNVRARALKVLTLLFCIHALPAEAAEDYA